MLHSRFRGRDCFAYFWSVLGAYCQGMIYLAQKIFGPLFTENLSSRHPIRVDTL